MARNADAALTLGAARRLTRRLTRHLTLPVLAVIPLGTVPGVVRVDDAARPTQAVVLAGGCYWGVESVFDHVRGVRSATSGYATPVPPSDADPEPAAEAVRILYDPTVLTFGQILDVFFTVAHDPTEPDRQGPDIGAEYRSVVFVQSDSQRTVVQRYVDSLSAARFYPRPIVSQIAALQSFRAVDASQQDYAERHPTDPYIVTNDLPKLEALRRRFPQLYRN